MPVSPGILFRSTTAHLPVLTFGIRGTTNVDHMYESIGMS